MLLHDARRRGRVDAGGDLVLLEAQDRGQWNTEAIAEAVAMLERALRRGRPGPYQVQAAIAACHATAPDAADTDWAEIAGLYGELAKMTASPVVELNRAVAVAMADGPEAGLAIVDAHRGIGRARRTTTCCPRRVPTCCAASTAATKPPTRTARRSRSRAPTPNGATSAAGSTTSRGLPLGG